MCMVVFSCTAHPLSPASSDHAKDLKKTPLDSIQPQRGMGAADRLPEGIEQRYPPGYFGTSRPTQMGRINDFFRRIFGLLPIEIDNVDDWVNELTVTSTPVTPEEEPLVTVAPESIMDPEELDISNGDDTESPESVSVDDDSASTNVEVVAVEVPLNITMAELGNGEVVTDTAALHSETIEGLDNVQQLLTPTEGNNSQMTENLEASPNVVASKDDKLTSQENGEA